MSKDNLFAWNDAIYKLYNGEGEEHKSCYGNYMDENGEICKEGSSGLCSYCDECRRDCVNV